MDIEKLLSESLRESVETKQNFWAQERAAFLAAGQLLGQTIQSKNKVLIFGNGGSACDALHFSGELVNRFSVDRDPLPCIALTADAPLLTCIANDYDYSRIFERQVLALGQKGDLAIGISTSGNSANVISALKAAEKKGMKRLVLLGGEGGKIAQERLFDLALHVRGSKHTPRIQETHEWILHSLCDYLEVETLKLR